MPPGPRTSPRRRAGPTGAARRTGWWRPAPSRPGPGGISSTRWTDRRWERQPRSKAGNRVMEIPRKPAASGGFFSGLRKGRKRNSEKLDVILKLTVVCAMILMIKGRFRYNTAHFVDLNPIYLRCNKIFIENNRTAITPLAPEIARGIPQFLRSVMREGRFRKADPNFN